jgi:hypothetical protein
MTGLIWVVQLTHYPLMRFVERERFAEFGARHTSSISFAVMPGMLLELASLCLLLFLKQDVLILLSAALLILIWVTTFLVSVPCHTKLAKGFDTGAHSRLVSTNWIRTIGWTARTIILTYLALFSPPI